jgi:hypothetical protein
MREHWDHALLHVYHPRVVSDNNRLYRFECRKSTLLEFTQGCPICSSAFGIHDYWWQYPLLCLSLSLSHLGKNILSLSLISSIKHQATGGYRACADQWNLCGLGLC